MKATGSEGLQLIFGEDITLDDVAKVNSFLEERLSGLAKAECGSDERQAARSLRAAQLHLIGELRHSLPLANASKVSADGLASMRTQIRSAWNVLWTIVSPWQSHPDYDVERWRHVKFWDAASEVRQQALLASAFDRKESGRRSPD